MGKQHAIRVPYGLSVHGKEEIDAVVSVLRGNTAIGKHTESFEAKIAGLLGKRYGVMVNSGSSANLLALELLDLPRGAEVITPLLTFATTVAPIVQKGLIPVFVDVAPGTYLLAIDQIEHRITKRTKALLVPSLLGNVPDYQRLARIARKHKLWLIEDSCDTLGATLRGRPAGRFTHITTTSFYGSHIINGAGGGGLIAVNDPAWLKRLVVMRGWGRQSSLFGEKQASEQLANRFRSKISGVPYDAKFIFSEIGYNFLPLELSAAFALVQLSKLKRFVALRRRYFARLRKFFQQYERWFILPEQSPHTQTAWLAFPLTIRPGAPFTRLELVTVLERQNIQTRPVFTGNILKQPGFRRIPHRAVGSYPNTEQIMKNALVVGCHHGLAKAQLDYLELQLRNFFKRFE